MNARKYESPAAFKQAMEQRLRNVAPGGVDFERRRQLLVFDRFLARVVQVIGEAALLKGGLVLELRLDRARTTKDIDLLVEGSPELVLETLRRAGRLELGDFMSFEVSPDREHAEIQTEGMQANGLRYRVEARLGGRLYGHPFGVDVAFGDPIIGEPDVVICEDLLDFAGIAPPKLRLYPIESHIAEKLHAYTLPRVRINSRVKDLPDIALLGMIREIDAERLREALERTFTFRATHVLPRSIPEPPAQWEEVYRRMAEEDRLQWRTLAELVVAVQAFLDPILSGAIIKTWSPRLWKWK